MRTMDRDEWIAFVSHGTRTGKLATVRKDGSPHVAPIWFLIEQAEDGDWIVFNTGADTAKGKALARDPRISVCVDDERPPFAFVQLTAEVELSENLDAMLPWATAIGGRYMGEEQAESFGRRNAVPGELLVRGRITKVIAQADVSE